MLLFIVFRPLGFLCGVLPTTSHQDERFVLDGSCTSETSGRHGAAGLCAHAAVGAEPLCGHAPVSPGDDRCVETCVKMMQISHKISFFKVQQKPQGVPSVFGF